MPTSRSVQLVCAPSGLEDRLVTLGVTVAADAPVVLGGHGPCDRVRVALTVDAEAAVDAVAEGADLALPWPDGSGRLERVLEGAFERAAALERALAYREAVRRSPEWIEITDGDTFRIVDVSEGFEVATGFPRGEVVGKTPAEVLRSELHPAAFLEAVERAVRGPDRRWEGDMFSRRADGGVSLCSVRLRTLRMGPASVGLAYRRTLRASVSDGVHSWVQERYSQPWLAVLRRDGRVLDAHPEVGPLIGVSEAVVGNSVAELGISETLPGPGERLQSERWVGERAVQLTLEGAFVGHAELVVVVLRDITDRMLEEERRAALAADLVLARDQALMAAQAKSAFLAHMSHELRTPLNAVIGYAELLEDELQAPQPCEDLGRIVSAGHHLLRLVDDVLDLARVEAGAMAVHPERFEVGPILEEVATSLKVRAARRGQRVEVRHDGAVWTTDPTRVRQVLHNLLSNAVKYGSSGVIRLQQSGLRVQVVDPGPGIAPGDLERIFEPFHRAHVSGTGAGLGLPICRRLAEALGGTLTVASAVGVGSTFTLELPPRS